MQKITPRLLICVVLVLVLHVGVRLSATHEAVRIRMPDRPLDEIGLQLGSWTGQEVDIQADWLTFADSVTGINRQYRHSAGHVASVMVVAYDYIPDRTISLPHPPQLCYSLGGFEIAAEREVDISSGSVACSAGLLTVRRDANVQYVLYWYQLDGDGFSTRNALRRNIYRLRGSESWPPLVKVLMETRADDARVAEQRLVDLAKPLLEELHAW